MVFNVMYFSGTVNPLEGVRAIAVHVSVTVWGSSVREKDRNLMESLW
jgi:hypothetical protein